MAEDQDIQEPEVADAPPPQIGGGQPQPPAKLMLSDASRQKLDSIVSKMVANKEKDSDIQAVVNDFKQKYAMPPAPSMATASATPPPPEHQIQHDPIQDIRHVQEMANKPATGYSTAIGGMGGAGTYQPDEASLAQSKAYQDQYTKMATDLGATWGAKPEAVKQVLTDFPDEQDPDKLKANTALLSSNPAAYSRLKNANDIRQAMAKDGPNGVHDANVFNYLQNAQNYQLLTEENIPYQQQLMRQHNLESQLPQLEATQRPLINSLDPGLNEKYWNSADKELGLTLDEYAGLETERLFNPNKAAMDESILKHSRGIGEDGKANPLDMSTQPYTYQRGVENVKYNLAQNGRQNLAMYISEKRPELDQQTAALVHNYKDKMATATPQEQQQLQQQFNQEPVIQQANDLENGAEQLKYSESEDSRLYPLNSNDQATRLVRDAMQTKRFQGSDIPNVANRVASGAFNTYKGTWDYIKNLAINIAGSDKDRAFNNATSSGEKSITDITGYQGAASSGVEQPLNVPRETISAIQAIQNDTNLSSDEKQQKSVNYLKDNWNQLTVNPKAGQQNLTGKSVIYGAADMAGQIMGIASQSFMMGGAIGDASKVQKLASAFTPMYMSTQDQLYQQAVKDGKEHPLMESNMDAAIISLASLINPDISVVKRAAGMDSPIGKMIAGVSEDAWNKVLSTNKPILDQMSAGIKGTARQMGLAQLQYGLIAPVGQYVVHKGILNEDANLPDMIKDGVVNTAIQMAAPALLHGLWGGIKATEVNPMQKYSLVEAGLKPDQNIEIVDNQIKEGQISEVQGHQIKQLIKHAGEFMLDPNLKMTDGTPMNEQQVADNLYNSIKKKALETSLKTAPEPLKPLIQEKLHEVNSEIADGFTSDADKQKADLNQLLNDNLDRIKDKAPEMEQPVKDAIKQNTPEDIFKIIADKAKETKNVEGKEVSNQDEVEKVYGKPLVEKAIELSKQKPKANGENKNAPDQTKGEVEKPSEGANQTLAGRQVAPSIHPTAEFRTWNLGDMEGKPEDEAAKKHLEGVVRAWDQHPAGETGGEPFGQFVNRVIPAFDKILKEGDNNTTIVTHSSVLKAFKVWDSMGRPDVDKMTSEQKTEFATKYNESETQNGDLETFKGGNGDIIVIRHGQTIDNEKNNFRSGDTPLTQKGIDQAGEVGQQLKDKTGGEVPKIVTSDLPRTIHSSNIIQDALRKSETGTVLQREPGEVGGEGGQRSGMEPGQQGEVPPQDQPTPQGGGEVPPTKEVDKDWPFVEEESDSKITSTRNAVTEQKIEEAGLLPAMKEAKREFGEVWDEAQKKINKGFDVNALIDKLGKKPRSVTDLENAMILFHQNVKEAQLDAVNKDLTEARAKGDQGGVVENEGIRAGLLDDLQKIYDVDKAIGRETARGLNARKMMVDRRFSLINMQMEKSAANKGEPLTKEQAEEVQRQYDKIKETSAAYEARIKELEEENKKLAAAQITEKFERDVKAEKIKKKATAIKKDLKDNFDELRKIARNKGLSANPFAPEMIPVIGKIAKNLIRLGINTVEGITNHIYDELKGDFEGLTPDHIMEALEAATNDERLKAYKDRLMKSTDEITEKLSKNDLSKQQSKTKPLVLDKKARALQAENERAKEAFELAIKKDELKNRSMKDKIQDTFVKIERAEKLSSPITIAKLTAAAATRLMTEAPEELVGAAYSKVFPKLAKGALGEGGANVKALAKGYREAFTQGMKDSYAMLKGGKSDLESVYGKKGHLPSTWIDFMGSLHAALKAPVKRFAFERSLEKRVANAVKAGVDVSDPMVQAKLAMDSYKTANRAIFMQDNFVSKSYSNFVEGLERSKAFPNSGKAAATIMRWMIPFVKVPTNIVGEVGTMVGGVPYGAAKIVHATFTKGLDGLSSDEKDVILRSLKKGTIGAGAFALGFMRPDLFGGYYQKDNKDKNALKPGSIKVAGLEVPVWLLESPIFQTMQLGATIRKVKDAKVEGGGTKGLAEGVWAGATGLASHEPLIDAPERFFKVFDGPKERNTYFDQLAQSTLEPALLNNIAQWTDGNKQRKPTDLKQQLEMGIPGLRQNVPLKGATTGRNPRGR